MKYKNKKHKDLEFLKSVLKHLNEDNVQGFIDLSKSYEYSSYSIDEYLKHQIHGMKDIYTKRLIKYSEEIEFYNSLNIVPHFVEINSKEYIEFLKHAKRNLKRKEEYLNNILCLEKIKVGDIILCKYPYYKFNNKKLVYSTDDFPKYYSDKPISIKSWKSEYAVGYSMEFDDRLDWILKVCTIDDRLYKILYTSNFDIKTKKLPKEEEILYDDPNYVRKIK